MIWDCVLLSRLPERNALRDALAAVFRVRSSDVGVFEFEEEVFGDHRVRAFYRTVRGEFVCVVDICVDDEVGGASRLEGAKALCAQLGVRAFVDDGSVNPCAGLHVAPSGAAEPALLDPELEDQDEYRLQRRDPRSQGAEDA